MIVDQNLQAWMAEHGQRGLLAVDAYLTRRGKPCTNMRKLGRKFVAAAGILPGYQFAFSPADGGKVRLHIRRLPAVSLAELAELQDMIRDAEASKGE